jgi:hypothetical protein
MAFYGHRREFTPDEHTAAARFLHKERGWSKGRLLKELGMNRENLERLFESMGYVAIDDPSLRGADRYVPAERIDRTDST